MNDFANTFNRLLRLSGKSVNQVAELANLDRAYVLRLSTGARTNPSGAVVIRLFVACVFDVAMVKRDPTIIYGLEELLLAAASTSASKQLGEQRLPA